MAVKQAKKPLLTIDGWPVIESSGDARLRLFKVPGTIRQARLRKDVGPYLVAFAAEYDRLVRRIDVGTLDDWSWSPLRDGRASSLPSKHCGGVAVDLNATGEGAQGRGLTWWLTHPTAYAALKRLLKKYRLLTWGGSWKSFRDPMHFELAKGVSVADVKAEMARLGIRADGTVKK